MTDQSKVEALRRDVARLADVLVHDCSPHAETCWCFGQADVRAYQDAKKALARATRTENVPLP